MLSKWWDPTYTITAMNATIWLGWQKAQWRYNSLACIYYVLQAPFVHRINCKYLLNQQLLKGSLTLLIHCPTVNQ